MVEPNSHHAQHPDWIIFGVNTKLPPAPNIPELIIFHPKRYWQQNCIQTQTQTSQIKQLFHCSTTIPQILTSNYLPWNVDHPLQKTGLPPSLCHTIAATPAKPKDSKRSARCRSSRPKWRRPRRRWRSPRSPWKPMARCAWERPGRWGTFWEPQNGGWWELKIPGIGRCL